MTEHRVWYVHIVSKEDPGIEGWGECAPLPVLSCDYGPDYEDRLRQFCADMERTGRLDKEALRSYPSMLFGLETAFMNYESRSWTPFDTPFSKGLTGIPINGLIWMGSPDDMAAQIENKLSQGFRCLKLKISSKHFEEELALLKGFRNRFSPDELTLRVDANGAFTLQEVKRRLNQLAELHIHSIEQPIKAGQWEQMAGLTAQTPVHIALDEELIGIHTLTDKVRLLDTVKPQFLVLKPSLHGGISGGEEWIRLATERNIGWWVTSALESNVGLNAIAQWCSTLSVSLHQGLGTGALYRNNVAFPLSVVGEELLFTPSGIQPGTGVIRTTNPLKKACRNARVDSDAQLISPFTLTLHSQTYNFEGLQRAYADKKLPDIPIMSELMIFLKEWYDPSPDILIQTSGTTGAPMSMRVKKKQLVYSASLTCAFFGLKEGDACLLSLPMNYIAAKMMVIRALFGKLNLWLNEPHGHPFEGPQRDYAFVPLVPLQLFNTLQSESGKAALSRCKTVLLGGGPVSPVLENAVQHIPTAVYASYGMAETLSHVALRCVNGPNASPYYTPLPDVNVGLSSEGCLIIDAPGVCDHTVHTGDRVELLPDGRFRVLGRKDNLILTGGKKVQAEYLESRLSTVMEGAFAITAVPDAKFGERIVLVTESAPDMSRIQTLLPSWQHPRQIIEVQQLPLTASGKIDRRRIKEWALTYRQPLEP